MRLISLGLKVDHLDRFNDLDFDEIEKFSCQNNLVIEVTKIEECDVRSE